MATDIFKPDVLQFYKDAKFRGVAFPYTEMRVSLSQDNVEHKYPYRDAGLIEGVGRASNIFTFKAPFRNGTTGHSDLFPTVWRSLLTACADKSTGELVHPEMGTVNVKCKSCTTSFDAMRRDGVDVDLEFVETLTKSDEDAILFGSSSPAAATMAAAVDFDKAISDTGFTQVYPESLKPDLLSAMKALNGLVSQIGLGLANIGAAIDGMLGDLDGMISLLESENNPALAGAIAAATAAFAATIALAQTITGGGRDVSMAVVVRDSNLSAAAGVLGQKVDDFLKLNPALGTQTRIPAGTQVLIYV